jgi:MYXO-CTERM domain-containing protein
MLKTLNRLAALAALAGAALLGTASRASAYIEVDYSIDGGARTFGASSTSSSVFFSNSSLGGLFNIQFNFDTTNTPGGQQALVTQSNNSVATLYSSGVHTLHIYVSSNGFTQPQSPPPTNLGNSSSITEASGSTSVTFTSYADSSNTLFGMSGGTVVSTGYTYSVSGQQSSGGVGSSTAQFSPNGATYSLTNVGDYTMAANTNVTVVSGNTTVTPTPAPAGMALALSGLPLLVLVRLRRRKAAPIPLAD